VGVGISELLALITVADYKLHNGK